MHAQPSFVRFLPLVAVLIFGGPAAAGADQVLRWNRLATDASAAAQTDPLTESRLLAIVHVAMHDALNAVECGYAPYEFRASVPGGSKEAAVAAAAHAALSDLLPGSRSLFDAALSESLLTIPESDAKARGLEAGRAAAAAILAARREDGADVTIDYRPGTLPGNYRPTPPDFTPAFASHWGTIAPFVLERRAQFRPAPPAAPDSEQARAEIAEVEAIGASESPTRTADQSEIARFWYEHSTQGWNRIAREVSAARKLGLSDNARLFALVNLAMADGFIAGFEAKYHYNYWRPATAIRAAGSSRWLSYLPTPPVPDHPSTHTVLGAAAAAVLARFFGTDAISFSMTSGAPYAGITRQFCSFSEAARENGSSRVFAGIHFPDAVRAGYLQGSQIGAWVFDHALSPALSEDSCPSESKGPALSEDSCPSELKER